RGVQTDPEREREDGDEGERRRLPKFPKSEAKVVHVIRCAALAPDRQGWRGGRATSTRAARSPRAKRSHHRGAWGCGPTLQRVATKAIGRARMRPRYQSRVR